MRLGRGKQDGEGTREVPQTPREKTMNVNHDRRCRSATVAAILLATLGAAPASALGLPDPSLPSQSTSARASNNHPCWLQRVGTQLVRCDDLTGNGVKAPLWVPEQ